MRLEKTGSPGAFPTPGLKFIPPGDRLWFSYADNFEWKDFQNVDHVPLPSETACELVSLCFALMVSGRGQDWFVPWLLAHSRMVHSRNLSVSETQKGKGRGERLQQPGMHDKCRDLF